MKKLIIILFAMIPLSMVAQEVKIAYVDFSACMMAMPDLADYEKKMADLRQKYQTDIESINEELQKKSADYYAQQEELTENIKMRKIQELRDLEERLNNFIPIAQQDIEKNSSELMQPIQQKVLDAIKAVAEENKYTYVLEPSSLLYVAPNAIDATPQVKAKLGI